MTLQDNKKIALSLIEEYTPNSNNLSDDEDILNRINLVYSTSYQELSQVKKILKTKTLREVDDSTSEGYEELSMPYDLYQLKRVVALDELNNDVTADYKPIGNKIYIKNDKNYKYILEYYAYPSVINEDTKDNFELEIDQDAQMILPYAVANDILKSDPSSDYTAFKVEYDKKLQALDTRREVSTVTVKEGVL